MDFFVVRSKFCCEFFCLLSDSICLQLIPFLSVWIQSGFGSTTLAGIIHYCVIISMLFYEYTCLIISGQSEGKI